MLKLLSLFLVGGLGTLARYWLSGVVQSLGESGFPVGTLAVNLLGCAAFGFVWSLADERLIISGETRVILLTGLIGAFTTFSTFAFETANLLRDGQWWPAAANLCVSNVCGVLAVIAGIAAGKLV